MIGMNQCYTICDHEFTSREIMTLCAKFGIIRRVRVLAPQSKYFHKDLTVIKTEYSGRWYQVQLNSGQWPSRKYTFPNNKIEVSQETLNVFEEQIRTRDKPKDYIEREFKPQDIIFHREFYRVNYVFGDIMKIKSVKGEAESTVVLKECSRYLIIDDPIVHLAIH